jgi:hypothetical protein
VVADKEVLDMAAGVEVVLAEIVVVEEDLEETGEEDLAGIRAADLTEEIILETDLQEKCTKQLVLHVEKNAKFRSSQLRENLFIAKTALRREGSCE